MKRNPGEGFLVSGGEKGSDSAESSDEELNFKRTKRLKRNGEQNSVREVDSRRCSNGHVNGPTAEVIRHKAVVSSRAVTETRNSVLEKLSPECSPVTSGDEIVFSGGITYKASATEIMKQMGFDKASGLGRLMNNNELSPETLKALETRLFKKRVVVDDEDSIDLEEELPVRNEEVRWLKFANSEHSIPDFAALINWRVTGPRKKSISNEDEFVDPEAFRKVSALRKCLDCLSEYEYQQLRARCNPFESLGKGPFVSRAGMKMANLDAILSFSLTQPTSSDKQPVLSANDLLYFADVCAGPGGFSEYILFRRKWGAKGFGMTLKAKNDFDTGSFYQGSPESFEPIYGPAGDGDVYNPKNTFAFINHVLNSTEGRGVHLLMADGGFEVSNKELTEIYSYQIYLSQCYLALKLVRPGGMFVCKFFDTITPFSVGLIYLMYLSFEEVAIHKPHTSRPANSERYLICKCRKNQGDGIAKYLFDCYDLYWKWTCHYKWDDQKEDIIELVPKSVLSEDTKFIEYIRRMNSVITRQQVKNLEKMVIFARNPNLRDRRYDRIKRQCLEFWKIPEVPNRVNSMGSPDNFFKTLAGDQSDFLGCQQYSISEHNLEAYIRSPYDWRVVVIEASPYEKNRGFYLSYGGNRVYRHDGAKWALLVDENLELCKETLVYGEFVEEIINNKPSRSAVRTFHIIDAMILGGVDVSKMHYTSRQEVCVKFAKSMNKSSRDDLPLIRTKIPVRMENIADIFDRLENRVVPGNRVGAQLVCPVDHTDETLPFIKPAGVLFIKITKDPWTMALSKTSNRKYYFNLSTGASKYDLVPESVSSFDYTMQNRIFWWWDKDLKTILATQDVTSERPVNVAQGSLNPQTLLRFVGGEWQNNRTAVMRRLSSSSSSNHSSS